MRRSKIEIADGRAHTDASLDAERATLDAGSPLCATNARKLLDDLTDHDRLRADLKLLKFRQGVDRRLSRERGESPAAKASVSHERDCADQRRQAERDVADALLQQERRRSDTAVEANRNERDVLCVELSALRRSTDEQLQIERCGADSSEVALGESRDDLGITRSALVDAETKEGRQHDVLAAVAHDLRGPLNVIFLRAQSIAKMETGQSVLIAAEAIELAAVRMERLLNDLLDVARIESGTLHIDKQRQDIGALLLEVLRAYEPTFSARDIAFTVDTSAGPIEGFFDSDRISQVLSNLLGNAMKFTQCGGTVALHAQRQANGVAFTVRDNGPGIPQSALPHVFKRFWQIDSNTRHGLGLGLHICENIIQAHGGRIWVDSEVGKGATFRFTVPTA